MKVYIGGAKRDQRKLDPRDQKFQIRIDEFGIHLCNGFKDRFCFQCLLLESCDIIGKNDLLRETKTI
jgi:hypothetical protein